MEKLLNKYELTKLNKEDTKTLNRLISNKIEAVIKSLQTKKSPEPDEVTAKFYGNSRKDPTSILLKFFNEIDKEGALSNSFMAAA